MNSYNGNEQRYCNKTVSMCFGNTSNSETRYNDTSSLSDTFIGCMVVLYVLTMLLSLVGNGIVVYIVFKLPNMRTIPNLFIANLSVSDIIITIACTPFTVLSNIVIQYWTFGQALCPIVHYIQLVTVLQRAFSLTALTLDSYKASLANIRKKLSKFKLNVIIISTWVIALGICIPTALYSKVQYLELSPGRKLMCIESWPNTGARLVYSIAIMALQFALPLTSMLITYVHLAVAVWRRCIPGEADRTRDERVLQSKYKTIKMLVLVVVLYAVSWLPLHVLTIYGDIDSTLYDKDYVQFMWIFSHWMSTSNAGSNPVIYGWMNSSFQSSYKLCVNKIFRRNIFKLNDQKFKQTNRRNRYISSNTELINLNMEEKNSVQE